MTNLLHNIPIETLVAVATGAMPLDVFADWLEDHGHPWQGFVRALAARTEANYEARFPRRDLDMGASPYEAEEIAHRAIEVRKAYPFARAAGWELIDRHREYFLTLYASRAMLLNYLCEIVRRHQPGVWHRTTIQHVPYLVPFHEQA